MFSELPAAIQQRYRAYADGLDAWIDHVILNPTDIPGEFVALGVTPTRFSVEDLFGDRLLPGADDTRLGWIRSGQPEGNRWERPAEVRPDPPTPNCGAAGDDPA
jgi:hypothetical protein